VAEEAEDPESVRRPPIRLVAVEDHRGVTTDPLARHECGKALRPNVVAAHWVIQIGVPIHLDTSWDVPSLIKQRVLIGLHHHDSGRIQIRGEPLR
jgi:hypothetical protein